MSDFWAPNEYMFVVLTRDEHGKLHAKFEVTNDYIVTDDHKSALRVYNSRYGLWLAKRINTDPELALFGVIGVIGRFK